MNITRNLTVKIKMRFTSDALLTMYFYNTNEPHYFQLSSHFVSSWAESDFNDRKLMNQNPCEYTFAFRIPDTAEPIWKNP